MSKSSLVTNGKIKSMVANKAYKDGWDRIYGKKAKFIPVEVAQKIGEKELNGE